MTKVAVVIKIDAGPIDNHIGTRVCIVTEFVALMAAVVRSFIIMSIMALVFLGVVLSKFVRNIIYVCRTPSVVQMTTDLPAITVKTYVVVIVEIQTRAADDDIGSKACIKL